MEHTSLAQDEIRGLKVTFLTIKVSADLLGFFPHIQPANDRKTDPVLLHHFLSVFLPIDRQCDDADICLFELFLVSSEVRKLQITEGSPMSSIEKDNIPFLLQIFGDRQTSPAHSSSVDTREWITVIQHHRDLIPSADLRNFRWLSHCRGLAQTPKAAWSVIRLAHARFPVPQNPLGLFDSGDDFEGGFLRIREEHQGVIGGEERVRNACETRAQAPLDDDDRPRLTHFQDRHPRNRA